MPKTIILRCPACRGRYSGDEALRRHRVLAGDRYRCMSPEELRAKNYYLGDDGAWHRGASLLHTTTASLFDAEPELAQTPANRIARGTDPETSHIAARAVAPRTGSQKAKLLAAYRAAPEGLTDFEAAMRTGLSHQSVTKRASDLRNEGFIEKIERRTGPYGVPVSVCRAVSA